MFWLYFSLVCFFDLLGITLGKLNSIYHQSWMIIGAIISFTFVGLFFSLSLEYKGIALANMIWVGVSAILITIAGYYIFKETISSLQLVGIGVILIGVFLINKP